MTETVTIPRQLLAEIRDGLTRLEEILATLEELADREGSERVKRAEEEIQAGNFKVAKTKKDLDKLLE